MLQNKNKHVTPVSYTHLDVYKRQDWGGAERSVKTEIQNADGLFLGGDQHKSDQGRQQRCDDAGADAVHGGRVQVALRARRHGSVDGQMDSDAERAADRTGHLEDAAGHTGLCCLLYTSRCV